jgi:hypothetical protein
LNYGCLIRLWFMNCVNIFVKNVAVIFRLAFTFQDICIKHAGFYIIKLKRSPLQDGGR